MGEQQPFFTFDSLATLGGACSAVVIVGTVYRRFWRRDPALLALLISQLVAFVSWWRAGTHSFDSALLAFLNGLLIFVTAIGITMSPLALSSPADDLQVSQPVSRTALAASKAVPPRSRLLRFARSLAMVFARGG
jgi:hypothetical protein